ncbi:MAG: flagellar M-ring protein FliF [Alphaproteobacteria bacterium]|nr:flagellar M-ring protein FliF [Alphaproteobacteria bacterium]
MRQLGPVRIATMAIVAAGMIGFFMFMTSRLATPDLSLLYSDLTIEDSSAITSRLDSQNITYEIRGGGTQIYVPQADVARVRLIMAGDGLPNGGSVGYELFDDSSTLGTTNFVQRINQARALEGELSRTISAIRQVKSARVHLVLPRREVFSRDQQEPSASVVVQLNGSILQPSQVVAIQHLVSTAVPGLQPSRISVIDNNGRLLARGGDNDEEAFSAANGEEARQRYETRLARSIEKLLERSVGIGAVRAEVSADIDFDRVTTSDESYDPDGQVARSTQTVEQEDDSAEADPDNSVSVANNLPGAVLDNGAASTSNSSSRRIEETVNFEISRTVTTQVRETGNVKRLTVAVLVDGIVDGEGAYTARTPEELAQYDALVKSAIGFEEARGDVVEVVNLQFVSTAVEEVAAIDPGFLGLSKADLFRIAEMLVLGIVAVLVILLVVRPLITRAFDIAATADPMATQGMLPAGASTGPMGQLAPPVAGAQALPDGSEMPEGAEASAEVQPGLDISGVDGRVQASSMNQINQVIGKHPDETVAILRQWMYQES